MSLLIQLNNSARLPLLAKQDFALWTAPDDALWKNAFVTAMEPALRGAWRLATKNLVELAGKVGDWPAIWHNIAVLRSWLADTSGAIEAWRKFAQQDIPLDDKVEAEALAQLLDAETVDLVDLVMVTYPVTDVEACQAMLMASPRAPQMPLDLSRLGSEDEPPPKGAWWLVDREIPPSGKELTFDQVPMIVGHVFLYGKQTDRDARLELVAYRTELAAAKAAAQEIVGTAVGAPSAEEVENQSAAVQHLLSWNWRLPDDTPPEKRLQLIDAKRADVLLNRWTAATKAARWKNARGSSQRRKVPRAAVSLDPATGAGHAAERGDLRFQSIAREAATADAGHDRFESCPARRRRLGATGAVGRQGAV